MGDRGMIGMRGARSARAGWRAALGGVALGLGLAACLAAPAGAQSYRETLFTYHDGSGGGGLPATATIVNPSGPNLTTQFTWDGAGNLITVTDPGGRRARGLYRADRRLSELHGSDQDAASASVSRFRYDASHRLQYADRAETVSGTPGALSGSAWNTTEVVYTNWGRVDRIIDPAGDESRFVYANNDKVRESVDGEGRRTYYAYYPDGTLYCTRVAFGTSEMRTQRRVSIGFDNEIEYWWSGNYANTACVTSIYDPNTRIVFDNYRRAVRMDFPEGVAGNWTYGTSLAWTLDPVGNRQTETTRAGQLRTHDYDASNRLLGTEHAEGEMAFAYNLAGERVRAEWDEGGNGYVNAATDYGYDFAGRLISETQSRNNGAQNLGVGYEYDASGNRTAIRWPDGWTARYKYDGASRLVLVCEDADGSTATGSAGGVAGCEQILAAYAYDRLGRRTQTDYHGPLNAGSSGVDYTYTINSRLVRLDHRFNAAADVTFAHSYDRSGRLTATHTNLSGWLWSAGGTAWNRSYTVNTVTDRVTGWSGHQAQGGFVHDGNGNLTNTPWRYMPHDSMNRMTAIAGTTQGSGSDAGWVQTTGASASSAFLYDPDGRRIVRTSTVSGIDNLRFAHAGDMEIADINDQGGSGLVGRIVRRYVPGAAVDERVAMVTTNTATCASLNGAFPYTGSPCASATYEYYHADRQGNVIALATQTGARTAQYVYTPYGVEEPYNTSANPYRYTGRRLEREWGIFHYRARYYDPALGRFLQTDPVLYADQMNLYAYVGNNPLNATDPTGEIANFILQAGIGALIGGGIEAGRQLLTHGEITDGGAIARSAAAGAVTGLTGGLAGAGVGLAVTSVRGTASVLSTTAGRAVQGSIMGASGGAAGEATNQIILADGDLSQVDAGAIGDAALIGAAAGGVGGALGAQVEGRLQAAGFRAPSASDLRANPSGMAGGTNDPRVASGIANATQGAATGSLRALGNEALERSRQRDCSATSEGC